jgi:hypothetical protein
LSSNNWRADAADDFKPAELHGVIPVPIRPESHADPSKLAGLGDLSSYRRQLLGLDQVEFALTTLEAAASWPDASKVPPPDTGPARDALQAIESGTASGRDGRAKYLDALRGCTSGC